MKTLYLPIIYLVTLSLCCWLGKRLPMVAKLDAAVQARQSPIDGLRGILATSVVAFHFYTTYGFGNTGKWVSPTIPLLANMGAVPVSLFFLITGYLFLRKLRAGQRVDWMAMYLGRVKRIYPLYVSLAVACAVIVVLQHQDHTDFSALSIWLAKWLGFDVPPLRQLFAKPLIAGAVWTLAYEWAFYSILPLLAYLIYRLPKQPNIGITYGVFLGLTTFIAVHLFRHTIPQLYLLFALALVAVYAAEQFTWLYAKFRELLNVVLPVLTLGIMVYTKPYSLLQMGLLALLFGFIANGYSYGNLLQHPVLKFLGEISYSLYLLHGVVIYLCFFVVPGFNFDRSINYFYAYLPVVMLLVIGVATLTHEYIEKPFYQRKINR